MQLRHCFVIGVYQNQLLVRPLNPSINLLIGSSSFIHFAMSYRPS